jgi:hypothetical protein
MPCALLYCYIRFHCPPLRTTRTRFRVGSSPIFLELFLGHFAHYCKKCVRVLHCVLLSRSYNGKICFSSPCTPLSGAPWVGRCSHRLLQKLRFPIWYSDPTVIAPDLPWSHASRCRKSPFRHQLDALALGSRLNRSPSIWAASLAWELYFNARTVQFKGGWVSPASHSATVFPLGSRFKAV